MKHNIAPGQRVGIIGSGIAGLTAAYLLSKAHEVVLYEAQEKLGGHTNTEHLTLGDRTYPINTGFIVYNDQTYPNFIKLMQQLGVKHEPSNMSFSVRCETTGLAYNGTNLNTLFAQRKNLIRPSFYRMIFDILRFNRETTQALAAGTLSETQSLSSYLTQQGYSKYFIDYYIIPMGAAIWSASVETMMKFPLTFFLRFFDNHGMLSVNQRPQWRVLAGGSDTYIEPLTRPFKHNVRANTRVASVTRHQDFVQITTSTQQTDTFDQLVFACHSDQALALLTDPTETETNVLGAIPYQQNDVTLHSDTCLMPKEPLAWASWNYHIPKIPQPHAMVTYHMNQLQNLDTRHGDFFVTLNRNQDINPNKIIKQFSYAHPVFTPDGIAAQKKHATISGVNRTHYCGAYWLNGFHEDGVNSALSVTSAFGIQW